MYKGATWRPVLARDDAKRRLSDVSSWETFVHARGWRARDDGASEGTRRITESIREAPLEAPSSWSFPSSP